VWRKAGFAYDANLIVGLVPPPPAEELELELQPEPEPEPEPEPQSHSWSSEDGAKWEADLTARLSTERCSSCGSGKITHSLRGRPMMAYVDWNEQKTEELGWTLLTLRSCTNPGGKICADCGADPDVESEPKQSQPPEPESQMTRSAPPDLNSSAKFTAAAEPCPGYEAGVRGACHHW
jgi:hypothetical protein